jgi:uncharacterized protein YegL
MISTQGARMAKPKTPSAETLVTFLLDRSGSMAMIKDDTVGAFNTYLETLQKEGAPITFSLLQFDSVSIDTLCKNQPVAAVAALTLEAFQPRGSTPLIDACLKTIKAVEEALAKRGAKRKVVICFQTDGQENASTGHTWNELNALIKDKSVEGWQFNFMGAGIDAYTTGALMGVRAASTLSYDHRSEASTRAAFAATAVNTASFASSRSNTTEYVGAQRDSVGDRFAGDRFSGKSEDEPKGPPVQSQSLIDDISL